MTIDVCGPRVLIKPAEVETVSAGGIITVSSTYEEKLQRAGQEVGTVVAIGDIAFKAFEIGKDGEHIGKPWCEVGDKVQYAKYACTFVRDLDTEEEFVIVNDEDIKAVLERG